MKFVINPISGTPDQYDVEHACKHSNAVFECLKEHVINSLYRDCQDLDSLKPWEGIDVCGHFVVAIPDADDLDD